MLQNHSKNMHHPSVSIPYDVVRTPEHSTQPSYSTLTGQLYKIRITEKGQRDGDSQNTSKIAQIGIYVRPDLTLLLPMTENNLPEPILTKISYTFSTKSSDKPYTPTKRPVLELKLVDVHDHSTDSTPH